jgi:hypothetical protein
MSARESNRIPWASLAVVATFVSGTLIVPKAFDLLRPPEKERAQQFSGADLEVDARLWEDPFAAVRRHESERVERCKNPAAASRRECDAAQRDARRSPQALRAHLDANLDGEIDAQSTLLIAVLVPGNPFVGAEEARRRTRFALLSGLQAEGYYPDSAEQIGLMQVPLAPITALAPLTRLNSHRAPTVAATSPSSAGPTAGGDLLHIPYELLSRNRNLRAEEPKASAAKRAPYHNVVVVWMDEAAMPGPKLDGVARLLDTVVACRQQTCPRLAVVGPSSSDGLDLILHGLEAALTRRASAPEHIDASLANGYRLLAQAHFFSPAATIAEEDLPLLRRYGYSVEEFFTAYFAGIVPERARLGAEQRQVHFTRTIGTDNTVAALLAGEVLQRLPTQGARRVVTLVEADSIYARGLEQRLRFLLSHGAQISRIEQLYFFRGIDGITVRDGAADRQPPAAKGKGDADAVEWPESRDQLDYLRRMAEDLKASERASADKGGGPIGAIGIFANDVHDKLLVLQALHDTFPDKVFFTTDMDARFVHPRVLPFTRNLVIASSLPLKMPPAPVPAAEGGGRRAVQEGAPPMRDVYQTAAYLAARMAACTEQCEHLREATQAAIASPSVYEVGRTGAVAIGGHDATARRDQTRQRFFGAPLALAAGVGALALALFWLPGTPALRQARAFAAQGAGANGAAEAGLPRAVPWFAAAYGAWLGVAAASVQEIAAPMSLGFNGALVWAALGALAGLLAAPGLGALGTWRDHSSAVATPRLLSGLGVLLLAGAAGWLVAAELPGYGEPLGFIDGISGWPSHFLHLAAVGVVLVSLDLHWHASRRMARSEPQWLGLEGAADRSATRRAAGGFAWQQWRERVWPSWPDPQAGGVDFIALWQRFVQLNDPTSRLVRVVFWVALTVALASAVFVVQTDRYVPELPVRGIEHRAIVMLALVAALGLLPVLVLSVADATLGTCRLLLALGRGRAAYPQPILERFAQELGPELAGRMAAPLERDRAGYGSAPAGGSHSLLDDWISIRLAARQTEAVAPLIVAPFIALSLLVIARSRLFDGWATTWPLAITAAAYLLVLVALAVALKLAAEKMRSAALARMKADQLWLAGAGAEREKLAAPLGKLIVEVEGTSTGAFAPMLEQPLVASLMVPLGSAGGVQLLDNLLLAR